MSPLLPEGPTAMADGAKVVRLIDGQDPVATHLQHYAEASNDVPRPTFARLMEAHSQRRSRHSYIAWGGAAAVALAAATLLSMRSPEGPHIAPDTKLSHVNRSLVHETSALAPAASASAKPSEAVAAARGRGSPLSDPTRAAMPMPAAATPTAVAPAAPPLVRLSDCEAQAAAAKYDAARSCFAQIARGGSTTDAELAWLEKARLEARALGRPDLALETFAGYRARFPQGKLALEARIAESKSRAAIERKSPPAQTAPLHP